MVNILKTSTPVLLVEHRLWDSWFTYKLDGNGNGWHLVSTPRKTTVNKHSLLDMADKFNP